MEKWGQTLRDPRKCHQWGRDMTRTFRSIAADMDSNWVPESDPSSLTQWYLKIRDLPIEDLELEDLCRALRQNLFSSELLHIVVKFLSEDVLSGFFDEGELLLLLDRLPLECFSRNNKQAAEILLVLEKNICILAGDCQILQTSKSLISKLKAVVLG
ncbi:MULTISPECIES: contact-dependent growth inhibition system immunity protein [Pseudomonas]|uniref:contact-dependent growth inhibition system immunity protein n=1 Tax=Pseudomonas TaxID=286 RepID=UPI0011C448C7|nr:MULTISPECIES: contact-dependent growth inhibition system immunity protein [Pseudomonas]